MIFQDLPIKSSFRWRGKTWIKVDGTHAVSATSPELDDPEHVPSHETVKDETTQEQVTEQTTEPITEFTTSETTTDEP